MSEQAVIPCAGTRCGRASVGTTVEVYRTPAWRHPAGIDEEYVAAAKVHYCADHEAAAKAVWIEPRPV